MRLTEEDMELEWAVWGDTKPWWCPHCKTFLSSDYYVQCDGSDPLVPKEKWKKHEIVKAGQPLTKTQFAEYLLEQYGQSSFEISEDIEEEIE